MSNAPATSSTELNIGVPFSFEVYPPRNPDLREALNKTILELAATGPDFISVTYGAGGSSRDATLDCVKFILANTDVELEFEPAALDAIADLAVLRQTGARGLRAILENVLGPIMFEVPSTDQIHKVIITPECVSENAAPTIVPRLASAIVDEPEERTA